MERDKQADLAICEKASQGPWTVEKGEDREGTEFCHIDGWQDNGKDWMNLCHEDAEFIAMAREALPYYIRRCMELVEQYEGCKQTAQWHIDGQKQRAEAAEAEVQRLTSELEKMYEYLEPRSYISIYMKMVLTMMGKILRKEGER